VKNEDTYRTLLSQALKQNSRSLKDLITLARGLLHLGVMTENLVDERKEVIQHIQKTYEQLSKKGNLNQHQSEKLQKFIADFHE